MAFREFSSIVGKQWASSSQEDREQYIDPYNPGDPLEFVAGGFVAPAFVEEVQAIVKSVFRYAQRGVNGHPKAIVNPWRTTTKG